METSSSTTTTTVPFNFEECDIDHLAIMTADMLERLLKHNDQIPLLPDALTRFHSRSPPGITVLDYLRRIIKYTNLERSCLLITLHYIDQMCGRLPRFTISSLTVHRFLIASVTVSTKALCDAFCTNSHYAKIGGIKLGELNVLEREFLAALDWRLTCTKELLQAYYVNLARSHSKGAYVVADPPTTSNAASSSSNSSSSSLPSPSTSSPVSPSSPTPDNGAATDEPSVLVKGHVGDIVMSDPPTENDDDPDVEKHDSDSGGSVHPVGEAVIIDVPVPPPLPTSSSPRPSSITRSPAQAFSPRKDSKRRQNSSSKLGSDAPDLADSRQARRRRVEATEVVG